MEKQMYFRLSDNADLNGLYLANMTEVTEHILNDIRDVHLNEIDQLEYTIQPVFMTEDEFNNLPEYEG